MNHQAVYEIAPAKPGLFNMPRARATNPCPANSMTMHSRVVCKVQKIYFFFTGQFKTITEPTVQILRAMSCHNFSQKNLFVIDHSDLG